MNDIEQKAMNKTMEALNQVFGSETLQRILPREANWRYYRIKKDKYAFSWTTEPVNKKFWYRKWLVTKKHWKVIEKTSYDKRMDAKEKSLFKYNQRKAELENKS
jgi:hypothetical protein